MLLFSTGEGAALTEWLAVQDVTDYGCARAIFYIGAPGEMDLQEKVLAKNVYYNILTYSRFLVISSSSSLCPLGRCSLRQKGVRGAILRYLLGTLVEKLSL
jgi:hypothetical protein